MLNLRERSMRGSYIEIVTEEDGVTKRTWWKVACDDLTKAMGIAHTAQELDEVDRRPGVKAVSMRWLGEPGPNHLQEMEAGEARIERVF